MIARGTGRGRAGAPPRRARLRSPWTPHSGRATTLPAAGSGRARRRRVHRRGVRHDAGDQRQMRSAWPRWIPSKRSRELPPADQERRRNAPEHQDDEEVNEEAYHPWRLEPAERRARGHVRLPVDGRDHRDEERRKEHEEAPEVERMPQRRGRRCSSLRWPRTIVVLSHAGRESETRDRLARRTSRVRNSARRAKSTPATGRDDERDRRGDARREAQPPRRLPELGGDRGPTSCRSPMTA